MEAQGAIDYEVVLADLESKILMMQRAAAAIRLIKNIGGATGDDAQPNPDDVAADAPQAAITPGAIRSDAFFGLTVVDAAKRFLAMKKRPCGTQEIVDALETGGFVHKAKNFYATVHSSLLRREEALKDVVRVKRKWALSEWYSAAQRAAASNGG